MTYQFSDSRFNPRPGLPDAWVRIGLDELIGAAPACAGVFFAVLEEELPGLVDELVLLRHPADRDVFAVYERATRGVGIQFDVDLDYICVWSTSGSREAGEHGDWGEGVEAQVRGAVDQVRSIVAPSEAGDRAE